MTDPINTTPNQPQNNVPLTEDAPVKNSQGANPNYPEPPLIISSPSTPKFSKSKLLAIGVVTLFFLASIPLALFLTQNRQDIRQRAASCSTDADCSYNETCSGGSCQSSSNNEDSNNSGECSGSAEYYLGKTGGVQCDCNNKISVEEHKNCQVGSTDAHSYWEAGGGLDCSCTSGCSNQGSCVGKIPSADDGPGGCCDTDADCYQGETCSISNGACLSEKSCQPVVVPNGGISCSADRNGVSVTNNSSTSKNLSIEWFAATCGGNSGLCGGSTETISKTLAPGENWNAGMYGQYCGSWQSDLIVSGDATCNTANGGTDNSDCSTPETTPTPPVVSYDCQCTATKIYRAGALIEPSQVKLNDTLTFSGYGWIDAAEETDNIDAMRITIKRDGTVVNTATQQVTVARDNSQDTGTKRYFKGESPEFVVDKAGNYTVEVLVHTTKKGWLGQ